MKARNGGASLEDLIAGAKRYAAHVAPRQDPRYTKNPSTWLNQKGWLDEYEPAGAGADGELEWWQIRKRERDRAKKATENDEGVGE